MVKYKSRAPKAQMSTAEQDAAAAVKAEQDRLNEEARLLAERQESELQRKAWEDRPGPLPCGWDSSTDQASGLEFYWRENDPKGSTTWDRPPAGGEIMDAAGMTALLEELKKKNRAPKDGEWQLCLQRIWDWEEVEKPPFEPDSVATGTQRCTRFDAEWQEVENPDHGYVTAGFCNVQRPGSKDEEELVEGLTLLRYFCKGPRRLFQELVSVAHHRPHEKLPPRLHNYSIIMRLVDLLKHEEMDVQQAAANAIAAACRDGHRPCQDAISMTGNAMTLLVQMLWESQTIQSACLAMGYACHTAHKGNQDAIAMVPNSAERLLNLLEPEDDTDEHANNMTRAVHFCVFWACSGAGRPTRTYWERSRGFCMSLQAPKPPIHEWGQRHCHVANLTDTLGVQNLDAASKAAVNLAARRSSFMTMGERAVAMLDAAPEPDTFNELANKAAHDSKVMHIPVSHNQDPAHSKLHLSTKRACSRQKEHERHHQERHNGSQFGDTDASQVKALSEVARALGDLPGAEKPRALMDESAKQGNEKRGTYLQERGAMVVYDSESFRPNDQGAAQGYDTLACQDSPRSFQSELEREVEDHDLHHLDPGLDDSNLCMINGTVRHCVPTGFLKPSSFNKRYGGCT